MEVFTHTTIELPRLEVLIFILSIILVFVVFNHTVINDSAERPASFTVSLPEQCQRGWTGKLLEKPSIKVESA